MSIFSGFLDGSKHAGELCLVFDLGSSSVGGALFKTDKSGVPQITFSTRETITLENNLDPDRFLALTLKALDTVANKVCSSGLGGPRRIFCVLSSPWYTSQTRSIKLEKNTPFVFTSKLADELIQKEIKIFEDSHLASYLESGNKVRQIELKSMKTILNGYATAEPWNQKTKSLEIVMFVAVSGDMVLTKIEDIIFRHFHKKEVKFSSFITAAFTVARDLFIHEDNFLLIDIGGEMTDISLIKKHVLSESISFPVGPNFLVRGIASTLNMTLEEAKSLLSLYRDGHVESGNLNTLEPVLNKLKTEWLQSFQQSLANISTDISLPSTVFIAVDQEYSEFFSEIIKAEEFNQYTLTDSKFNVTFLGTKELHGIASFTGNVERDPFIAMEAVYINRFL